MLYHSAQGVALLDIENERFLVSFVLLTPRVMDAWQVDRFVVIRRSGKDHCYPRSTGTKLMIPPRLQAATLAVASFYLDKNKPREFSFFLEIRWST